MVGGGQKKVEFTLGTYLSLRWNPNWSIGILCVHLYPPPTPLYTKEDAKLALYLYVNNNTTFIFPINLMSWDCKFFVFQWWGDSSWMGIDLFKGVFLFWSPSKIFDMEMELEWNGKWSIHNVIMPHTSLFTL